MPAKPKTIPLADISDCPRNKQVHEDFDPYGADKWFVEHIQAHGVKMPVVVRSDGVLQDGHRRCAAAKFLGYSEVPYRVDDDPAVWESAQQSRVQRVFARVTLHRDRLQAIVDEGKATRQANRWAAGIDDEHEKNWTEAELALGMKRETIRRALAVLRKIDELRDENPTLAAKTETIFRNRGMRPAADMLGETSKQEPETGDDSPDCGDWTESRAGEIPTKPRERRRKSQEPEQDEPDTLPFEPADDQWRARCDKLLIEAESILDQNDALDDHVLSCFAGIRQALEGRAAA